MAYGVEENKDDVMGNIVARAEENNSKGPRPDGVTDLRIILWGNGFQVGGDDGEFRAIGDPKNDKFLEELKEGYVPREIQDQYKKGVSVGLEDRRRENYTPPPPPKYISFSGAGTSMGAAAASSGGAVNTAATDGKPVVDESKPKTLI